MSAQKTSGESKKPFSRDQTHLVRNIGLITALSIVIAGGAYMAMRGMASPYPHAEQLKAVPTNDTVSCLGRLEPAGEVISLTAPTASQESRVDLLFVKEGDVIKKGQKIAVLDSAPRLKAGLNQAKDEVRIAKAKLAITLAGSKMGERYSQRQEIERIKAEFRTRLSAQASLITRLEAEKQNADTELKRYEVLHEKGALSESEYDRKRLAATQAAATLQEAQSVFQQITQTSEHQLQGASGTLSKIIEVRPVDIEAAKAEIARSESAMHVAEAQYAESFIYSPIDGAVLKTHVRVGEKLGDKGIAEIGKTQEMYAVAEVYQSDFSKIQVGQKATLDTEALPGQILSGKVERLGNEVLRQNVINSDTTSNIDQRIVETKVRLSKESSALVKGLTNLQVTIHIQLDKKL